MSNPLLSWAKHLFDLLQSEKAWLDMANQQTDAWQASFLRENAELSRMAAEGEIQSFIKRLQEIVDARPVGDISGR